MSSFYTFTQLLPFLSSPVEVNTCTSIFFVPVVAPMFVFLYFHRVHHYRTCLFALFPVQKSVHVLRIPAVVTHLSSSFSSPPGICLTPSLTSHSSIPPSSFEIRSLVQSFTYKVIHRLPSLWLHPSLLPPYSILSPSGYLCCIG